MKHRFFIASLLLSLFLDGRSQLFVKSQNISYQLPAVSEGAAYWVDANTDGKLDVLITGSNETNPFTDLYLNQNNQFVLSEVSFIGLSTSAVAVCDFNIDGFPDLFLTGVDENNNFKDLLYQNLGNGEFEQVFTDIQGLMNAFAVFADFDNDGDEDLVMVGDKGGVGATLIYENHIGEFIEIENSLTDVFEGECDVADFDLDGDQDIVLIGREKNNQGADQKVLELHENMGAFTFELLFSGFVGMNFSNIQWGDYDMDGDPDILANGSTNAPTHLVYIYKNEGNGNFSNIGIEIFGSINGSVDWGDFDTDGDLDFLITGNSSFGDDMPITEIYRNQGSDLFNKADTTGLPAFFESTALWGDYDADGDLDILVSGFKSAKADMITEVYENKINVPNTLATSPENLSVSVDGNTVMFNWDPSSDMETNQSGLSYNLEVNNIFPALSNNQGFRFWPEQGNTGHGLTWKLYNLPAGAYSCRVQAIDNHFAGSPFSEPLNFSITETSIEIARSSKNEDEYFTIFPNPFQNWIYIKAKYRGNFVATIEVINDKGLVVFTQTLNCVNVREQKPVWNGLSNDGKPAKSGIYFVRITNSERSETIRVIKTD